MKWTAVALGDACDVVAGGTPKRSESQYWGGGIPWVKISDMLQGLITSTEETISAAGLENSAAKLLPAGTLLISIFATIGRTAVLGCDATTNQAIVGIIPKASSTFDNRFLLRFLNHSAGTLAQQARGVAQSNINGSVLKALQIPLPPLLEQKRIAAILDAADALRAKRRESIEQLDSLVQATFLEMFGDASHDWEQTTVGQLAAATPSSIRTGPFGSQLLHSEFTDEGVRVLGIDNAVANEFRDGAPRFISPVKYEQLRRYTVIPGDVLITIMGTCGRCAIVPEGIGTAINTKHLCCITLEKTRCLPRFLHAYFLRHPVAQHHLRSQTKGAIMEGLNMGIIKVMPVRLPPLDLQARFTSIVESIEQQKARLKAHLAELDTLFASLQSRAFSGELCSSSPSRQHASA